MPNRWLVKTDPALLPLEEIQARKVIAWEGVTQPASLANLKTMRRGEDVLVYLTGSMRAVVATAKVRKGPYPVPDDTDGRLALVDLAISGLLARPVPLAELRGVASLEDWSLVRIPRLHVMSVPPVAWRKVLALSKRKPP